MTIFLRDKDNKTYVDLGVWVQHEKDGRKFVELTSTVDIENYSNMLLGSILKPNFEFIIEDFIFISELRGWLWENYFMVKQNDGNDLDGVVKELMMMFKEIGDRHGLHIVTD